MSTTNSKSTYVPKRRGARDRYRSIQQRYQILHNIERRRIDDCMQIIREEFFIECDQTVERILRTELPAEEE